MEGEKNNMFWNLFTGSLKSEVQHCDSILGELHLEIVKILVDILK